jgi:hypothetical protein
MTDDRRQMSDYRGQKAENRKLKKKKNGRKKRVEEGNLCF